MSGSWFGQSIRRNEDARLLTGTGLFVDDVALPGMLHVAFVRSPHARARIRAMDSRAALRRSGVVGIYSASDLGDFQQRGPVLVPPPPIDGHVFHARTQWLLAQHEVRFAGEAVALVVAESRYIAEDAAEEVIVDYDESDCVLDIEHALAPGAPLVHSDLDSNVAARVLQKKGDYAVARASADVVIARRIRHDRGAAVAIENRAVAAHWNALQSELTVFDTTQAPIPVRRALAVRLGLSESQVRVIAPFVGGGFGPKIMFYPEELLVPWLAMRLERPVKWTEDRFENFHATTQEREQIHDAEIAVARDGRILGLRDRFLHDTGAYDPYGLTVPINTQCTMLGPYAIANYESEFTAVFTNRPIVTPVRGAGRQPGVFVIERLLDLAARELGLDVAEIRRRNFIAKDAFPWNNEILYQDSAPLVYDSGDYHGVLGRAIEDIDYHRFTAEEQPRLRAAGRRVGIGIAAYVEGTGIGPYEGVRVTVEADGGVTVATGVGTQGQGHFTSLAQIAADPLGVAVTDVRVVTGDTREFHWGTGTFASRGAVVAGNACHAAASMVRRRILRVAAEAFGVDESEIVVENGRAYPRDSHGSAMTLGELAARANPLRGAVRPGTEPGLEATAYFGPERGCTASGVHAMIIEVDPETATIRILRYLVVHDCGRVINPLIVAGQIHGGVAHGIGNAFYERLVWDGDGQLVTASLRDYLLPGACEVPHIETAHVNTPSPLNPLGIKGVGEAGAIPVGALFAQAIENALDTPGLEILEMPLSPNRLFELMTAARADSTADFALAESPAHRTGRAG